MVRGSGLLRDFAELLSWCRGGVRVVTHRNADVDAAAAALTLGYVLSTYGSTSIDVCTPEGVDSVAKRVLTGLGFGIPESGACSGSRLLFVDVSSLSQVGPVEFRECAVVDHHVSSELVGKCSPALYDPEARASSALVAEVLVDSGWSIPRGYATLLLAGIMYDTRFLRLLSPRVLRVVARLIELGGDVDAVQSLMAQPEPPYAERVASLRGLARLGVYAVDQALLVAITCLGAYESTALRRILESGADVAIAIAARDEELRVTIRTSARALRVLGIPVAAELASYLARVASGGGGGHDAAAGAVVPATFLDQLEGAVAEFFRSRGFKFRTLDRGRWLEECR